MTTGTGGAATWRVTLTGAARHAPVSQLAAFAGGRDNAADGKGADELALGAGAGFPAGALVAHDDAAASTMARIAARRSGDVVGMHRIMASCGAWNAGLLSCPGEQDLGVAAPVRV